MNDEMGLKCDTIAELLQILFRKPEGKNLFGIPTSRRKDNTGIHHNETERHCMDWSHVTE
jgi:hypothetical protein